MNKHIISILLTLVLLLVGFAGCNQAAPETDISASQSTNTPISQSRPPDTSKAPITDDSEEAGMSSSNETDDVSRDELGSEFTSSSSNISADLYIKVAKDELVGNWVNYQNSNTDLSNLGTLFVFNGDEVIIQNGIVGLVGRTGFSYYGNYEYDEESGILTASVTGKDRTEQTATVSYMFEWLSESKDIMIITSLTQSNSAIGLNDHIAPGIPCAFEPTTDVYFFDN